jgi:hypothetical protein
MRPGQPAGPFCRVQEANREEALTLRRFPCEEGDVFDAGVADGVESLFQHGIDS